MKFIRELSEKEINEIDNNPSISYWRPVYQGDEIANYRCYKCQIADTFDKSPFGLYFCYHCGCKMLNGSGSIGFDALAINREREEKKYTFFR